MHKLLQAVVASDLTQIQAEERRIVFTEWYFRLEAEN